MSSAVFLLSSSQQVALASSSTVASQCQLSGAQKWGAAQKLSFVPFNGFRKDGFCVSEKDWSAPAIGSSKQQARTFVIMASTDAPPLLNDLPLNSFINSHGRIVPPVPPNTQATVFAVLDKNKKVQYIGFSKDLRNSLRILMGRRPEFCYFYKMYNLPALDQQIMMATRNQWMSELGVAPEGNTDPTQRKFWEQPADAGSISERGRVAAAKAKARTMQQMLVDRGIKEEMVYDPKLLEEGKCDVLPSQESYDDPDAASKAESVQRKSVSVKIPSGGTVDYDIIYEMKYKTNGGWMYDIAVIKDDQETRHRVICGRFFPQAVDMPEDEFLETIMGFLLYKKIPRHTEGLLDVDTFPINYFAITNVAQAYKDLKDWFPKELPDNYWRFNRIHAYGAQIDPAPPVGPENTVSLTAN